MLSDLEIIKQVKRGEFQNFEELAHRHSGICFSLSRPYVIASSGSLSYDSIQSQYPEIVLNAASSFSEEKNFRFSTWLGAQTRYWCLNQLKQLKQPDTILAGENIEILEGGGEEIDPSFFDNLDWVKCQLENYGTEQIRNIIKRRFFSGSRKPVSYKQVGKEFGLCYERIRQLCEEFINYCRNKLEREVVLIENNC